jgi:8-oxo-dGTP pyrophosphatase MutT (NUDIX family)
VRLVLTEPIIRERISRYPLRTVDNPFPPRFLGEDAIPAAVLAPLVQVAEGDWHLLYIKRTRRRDDPHSGQVAFPGGRRESGDTDLRATALREAGEELGIDPAGVRILGPLNPHLTISNHRVTPYAGCLDWPCELNCQPGEVSRAFTIPLDWLADPRNYQCLERPLPGSGARIAMIEYRAFDGETLWGLTARMTQRLLGVLGYDCGG